MSEFRRTLDKVLTRYENQKSLYDIAPIPVTKNLGKIPRHLRDLPEEELLPALKKEKNDPTWIPGHSVEALRNNFWLEYDNSQRNMRKMSTSNIFYSIMTERGFMKVCEDPIKLAWIVTPPIDYTKDMDALWMLAVRKLREILNMETDSPEIAKVQVQTALAIDMRRQGGYLQRSEQKIQQQTLVAHVDQDTQKNIKDIDQRILELERKNKELTEPKVNELIGLPEPK